MKKFPNTALVLIGYQNDYFSKQGILHQMIEESSAITGVLDNTLALLKNSGTEFGMVINTPIHFTHDYSELKNPVGILKAIAEVGAFKENSYGAAIIPEFTQFDDFIRVIPGKRGLNAFSNTCLEQTLRAGGITELVIAGTVTSICIDSTARTAVELGFATTILSDCTSSRTPFEQEFYCQEVFPLYATVLASIELLDRR